MRPEELTSVFIHLPLTDLDTMLYGYTNSIYVLDHTPESLPVSAHHIALLH